MNCRPSRHPVGRGGLPQAVCCGLLLVWIAASGAQELRVLPAGQVPDDSRLGPLKDLDGYFPFTPSPTVEAWNARADALRTAMRVALGLWPMPTKTPANAVVHGCLDMGDYTVEKVYLESFPGFYVTGNLYRSKQPATGRRPGVLCPHGHFADGRFGAVSREDVRREIISGAERFEDSGRNCIQAKCVQLARMGCVVFNYDMLGYCDSVQISFDLAHRFAQQRPEMISADQWGLFSPQAESQLQSVMGLQTYNSIRALDWFETLPDVDPQRIAVTGASGGGTQTFLLCALDPRPAAAIPAVMVSTAMQGGCTCENACLLRVGRGNVDFAALFAPRPLCLISANDWTKEMPTKGYPELLQHYQLLGAADRIAHHPFLHFGHNYNYVSRSAMYQWLNQQFHLGLEEPIVEEDYRRLGPNELTVWDAAHPRPAGGPDFERRLLRWWAEDAQAQLAAVQPRDAASLDRYRELVGGAMDAIIGRQLPDAAQIEFQEVWQSDQGSHRRLAGLLHHRPSPDVHEVLPVLGLVPAGWQQGKVAIWLDARGKAGLFEGGAPCAEVQRLLQANVAVIGVDLFEQGEFLADGQPLPETRRVNNPRESAAYTLGYNPSLFAQRVHDVLTLVAFVSHHELSPSAVWLLGLDHSGPWAAAAMAQAAGAVDCAAIRTNGFRFIDVPSVRDQNLLPGGAKYHDLPGMLALAAPHKMCVADEDDVGLAVTLAAYQAAGAPDNLQLLSADAAIDWLLDQ